MLTHNILSSSIEEFYNKNYKIKEKQTNRKVKKIKSQKEYQQKNQRRNYVISLQQSLA